MGNKLIAITITGICVVLGVAHATELLPGVASAKSRAEIAAGLKSHVHALYIGQGWIRDFYATPGPDEVQKFGK